MILIREKEDEGWSTNGGVDGYITNCFFLKQSFPTWYCKHVFGMDGSITNQFFHWIISKNPISTTDGFPSDCFQYLHWRLEPPEMTDWTGKNRICPSNNHTKHTDIYFQHLIIMGIFTTEMGEWTYLNNTRRQRKIIGYSHRKEPCRKSIALLDSFMHPILGWIALCHKQVIIDGYAKAVHKWVETIWNPLFDECNASTNALTRCTKFTPQYFSGLSEGHERSGGASPPLTESCWNSFRHKNLHRLLFDASSVNLIWQGKNSVRFKTSQRKRSNLNPSWEVAHVAPGNCREFKRNLPRWPVSRLPTRCLHTHIHI